MEQKHIFQAPLIKYVLKSCQCSMIPEVNMYPTVEVWVIWITASKWQHNSVVSEQWASSDSDSASKHSSTSGRPKSAERGLDQHHRQRQTTGHTTLPIWPDHDLGRCCSRPTEIPRKRHSTTRDSWFSGDFFKKMANTEVAGNTGFCFGDFWIYVCVFYFLFFISGVILLSTPFYYSLKIILQPWISFVFSCSWIRILRRKNSTCFWQMKWILFPSVCSLRNSWCVVTVWLFCEKGKLWFPTKPF